MIFEETNFCEKLFKGFCEIFISAMAYYQKLCGNLLLQGSQNLVYLNIDVSRRIYKNILNLWLWKHNKFMKALSTIQFSFFQEILRGRGEATGFTANIFTSFFHKICHMKKDHQSTCLIVAISIIWLNFWVFLLEILFQVPILTAI